MKSKMRTEEDSLGKLSVPEEAYYGIQTLRATQNFPISGLKSHPAMVDAVVLIKKAAALANSELGRLKKKNAEAIIKACDEILSGKIRDHFIVDVFQMGAGTSFHMNCNEVLANRSEEILGGKRGEYKLIHPNDHVNMGQSTNDVYPTGNAAGSSLSFKRTPLRKSKGDRRVFLFKIKRVQFCAEVRKDSPSGCSTYHVRARV
jgi:aspartate ammonia-lyase